MKASSIDPYILLQVFGIPADCAEARTKTVSNEGQSPIFDESFEFTISAPQLAVLRLTVLDDDFIGERQDPNCSKFFVELLSRNVPVFAGDDFIGQRSLPISSLRPGYRHVTLLADSGHPLLHATLFVHVTMCSRSSNDKKLRRKRYNILPRLCFSTVKKISIINDCQGTKFFHSKDPGRQRWHRVEEVLTSDLQD